MVGAGIGGGNDSHHTLIERLYALCAYASAVTIVVLGGYIVSTIARDAIMSAPWRIVLACMTMPLLAAAAVSCGNHRENRAVRAATWMIVAPLGAINPLAWLGALVILARPHRRAVPQHAAGDLQPADVRARISGAAPRVAGSVPHGRYVPPHGQSRRSDRSSAPPGRRTA